MTAPPVAADGPTRAVELAANLERVRERIARASDLAGRRPEDVTIVAVTKTWPADDIRRLVALGLTDVGENRDQEARTKVAECADLPVRWHFVGQLQRNKAASVARYADVVESVDRLSLVTALSGAAEQSGRRLGACLQVELEGTGRAGRGGARPSELAELAAAVAAAPMLDLLGVMAVAPLGLAPALAFERLAAIHERLLVRYPSATMRSAGMSGDLTEAIVAGATHVRLGSALLGRRDPLK